MRKSHTYSSSRKNTQAGMIIEEHTKFVLRIAKSMEYALPNDLCIDDLVQVGLIALLEANNRFNDSFDISLIKYAQKKIRGAMIDLLRKSLPLSKEKMVIIKRAQNYIESYKHQFFVKPRPRQVAEYLDIEVAKYHQLLFEYQSSFNSSIDEQPLEMPNILALDSDLTEKETKEKLINSIQKLSERDQAILSLYYFDELTLAEVSTVINVSESRISQILKEIKVKLRMYMNEVPVC